MRIATGSTPLDATALRPAADAAPLDSASPAPAPLQSAVLQPALAVLRALPDIDHERVAALRDALARGELPFDAARLAGLIERFHGGQP
jgi:negative regulator of flagellin synthesis FlgM